ncbi:general secretion pathway protein GspB [Rubrivivax benzoatilyticus]|uniref:General secretion pathway protein GspB n=2 Tax=Rubrivivax benzoatilyticus TaxID=316997 RepID=A0ABX0HQY0_9BURK|nr:general secretion pathway protein GspB [Rubrivivax benzoatilyticus]NHK97038.1 general secretion pathway protein GspB [Rubrivivax benzoatilyticus]NHL24753.1 general secretion pathway protein GspB [Rubrivivax benzoatilyticus]
MSYILDALRRADAERERGAVPGLHSQPATPPAAAAPPAPRRASWVAGAAALAVVGLGVGVWWSTQRPSPASVAVAQTPPAPAAPPMAPVDTPPAPPAGASAEVAPVPRVGPPRIVTPPATMAEPPRRAAATEPAPAAAAAGPRAPADARPGTPAAERAIPIDQLSAEQRRGLPQLSIGGAIYSEQPAARMLLVGGQLLHEGDVAAPGVTLERIGPRSAVLRWRELRYEVAY